MGENGYLCIRNQTETMRQEEINIQTLTDNEDIHVGYSDSDIVIIDSIQQFAEATSAHVSMSAIAVCTSGKVQAQMGGKQMTLSKNQVAVVPHNTLITDIMVSPDFNLKAMFFTSTILQNFLREKMNVWNEIMYIHKLRVLTLADADVQFFTRFYDLLSACFDKPADIPYRTDVIQSLLRGAVLGLCGALQQQAPPSASRSYPLSSSASHFQHFLDLLHSGTHRHRTVESYASELYISPKYLSVICKKHSGKTANEWITEHTLEDIRYYLRQTDLSIKQICDRMGFPNSSFFGKYVKEHFGMTPMQYRSLGR